MARPVKKPPRRLRRGDLKPVMCTNSCRGLGSISVPLFHFFSILEWVYPFDVIYKM